MLGRRDPWPANQRPDVARALVETITANIEDFLGDKPHVRFDLAKGAEQFPWFCSWIGAEGDHRVAAAEFSIRHNARA
jgi:hypothetical protein